VQPILLAIDSIAAHCDGYWSLNALPGHIVARQLALRPIDPYEGIPPTNSHVAVSLLARTFAIPRKALTDGLHKAELTGTIGTAQTVKSAVTLLLRCESVGCEVTTLLRNPWEPAPLLGFGPPAVVINGGVTDLVSQL